MAEVLALAEDKDTASQPRLNAQRLQRFESSFTGEDGAISPIKSGRSSLSNRGLTRGKAATVGSQPQLRRAESEIVNAVTDLLSLNVMFRLPV